MADDDRIHTVKVDAATYAALGWLVNWLINIARPDTPKFDKPDQI